MSNPTIISLGGSLIVPDAIDIDFLTAFHDLILSEIKKGRRFILICGGGRTSRIYQHAARRIGILTRHDLDWLGIHSTRLNAQLLRTIFRNQAHSQVVKNPNRNIPFKKPILIAAGWKPGFSTDYDAVVLAQHHHAKPILSLTNIDHVYDKNPHTHPKAKPLKEVSWRKFRKLVGSEWDPGLHAPFDPVASRLAQKLGLIVKVLHGKDMDNVKRAIEGRVFQGTTIH